MLFVLESLSESNHIRDFIVRTENKSLFERVYFRDETRRWDEIIVLSKERIFLLVYIRHISRQRSVC